MTAASSISENQTISKTDYYAKGYQYSSIIIEKSYRYPLGYSYENHRKGIFS